MNATSSSWLKAWTIWSEESRAWRHNVKLSLKENFVSFLKLRRNCNNKLFIRNLQWKNAKANFGDHFVTSCFNRKSNNFQKIMISIKHQQSRCCTHTNRVNQLAIHCFISKLIQFTLERFLHRHCERLEKGLQTKVLNLAPVNAFNTKRHPIKTGSYETLQLFFSIEACTWTCHPLLWPTSCRL